MKNTLLTFTFAFAATFTVQAQDYYPSTTQEPKTSEFKPVAGDRLVEAGTYLDLGNYYYSRGALKLRKFTSDNQALRLNLRAFLDNDDNGNGAESTYGSFTFAPGIERHFVGTSRLSPYIGAELPVSFAYSRYEDDTVTMRGGWNGGGNRAFIGVGLDAVAGVDFYIVKNFYVGLEFGAGISYRKYNEMKIDYKEPFFQDQTTEGGHNISFSAFSNSGLRVGFVF